jgi:hypothetical protein
VSKESKTERGHRPQIFVLRSHCFPHPPSSFLNCFFALFPQPGPLARLLRCVDYVTARRTLHCISPRPQAQPVAAAVLARFHNTPLALSIIPRALIRCRLLLCWRFTNRSLLRLEGTAEMSDSAKLDKILEALSSVGKRCTHHLCTHSPSSKSLICYCCAASHTLSSLDTLESKVGGTSSSSSPAPAGGGGAAAPFVEGSLLHQQQLIQ